MRFKVRKTTPPEHKPGDTKVERKFALRPRKIDNHWIWLEHYEVHYKWHREDILEVDFQYCYYEHGFWYKSYCGDKEKANLLRHRLGISRSEAHKKYCGGWEKQFRKLANKPLPEVPKAKLLR